MANQLIKIFPNEETGAPNTSLTFNPSALNSSALLFINGLKDGECASIEVFYGDECDGDWGPFRDCCGQITLNGGPCCNNFMVLPLSLKYRVYLTDEDEEYLNDPNLFEDVEIWWQRIPLQTNLDQFYHNCCEDTQALALENLVKETNRVANRLDNIYETIK